MYANFTVRVTPTLSKESAKGHFVLPWPWAASPETGTVQVGGGTVEWPVQSY